MSFAKMEQQKVNLLNVIQLLRNFQLKCGRNLGNHNNYRCGLHKTRHYTFWNIIEVLPPL